MVEAGHYPRRFVLALDARSHDLVIGAAHPVKLEAAQLTAFQRAIERYNAGHYIWFGIAPDADDIRPIAETVDGPFDDAAVAVMLNRITRAAGIAPFIAPVGLLSRDDTPDNP